MINGGQIIGVRSVPRTSKIQFWRRSEKLRFDHRSTIRDSVPRLYKELIQKFAHPTNWRLAISRSRYKRAMNIRIEFINGLGYSRAAINSR